MPKNLAIIGGGISGLSTALFHRLKYPNPEQLKIKIYESTPKVGGWVNSTEISEDGLYLYENGTRSLSIRRAHRRPFEIIVLSSLSSL